MNKEEFAQRGYAEALALLHECATGAGFVATPAHRQNYHRVWSRDGAILALAALMSGDDTLIEAARLTLETLAGYQGPHGEIPSNVDPQTGQVTYGNMAGRVDADLWFLIACGEYWIRTGDSTFLEHLLPNIEKVLFLLGAWQFNNRGLIYVPLTGDWADEYLHHGYVLYDQLLYLQAQRTMCRIHREALGTRNRALEEQAQRLFHQIRDNYWFGEDHHEGGQRYDERAFENGEKAAKHSSERHWMSSFSPSGYAYRFDAFANALVSLLNVADRHQRAAVDRFISEELVDERLPLLPAFHPVITPVDEDWEELHVMFNYTYKNNPYEYHNGGLWPMLTGFYAADLALRGEFEPARTYLDAVHRANAMSMEGREWSFPEYVHGRKLVPEGQRRQGWSAAAAVIAHHALQGEPVFRIADIDG